MTTGRRLLRTNALFRKKFQEGKPFCAKNAWKEAGSASVGSAHKRPQPSSEVLGKGLALFFPPNSGFPLCKDLSPLEEWHGLALFFHGFTLCAQDDTLAKQPAAIIGSAHKTSV